YSQAYKNFVLINGLLHRRTLSKQGMRLRLCVPQGERLEILDAYHCDRWAAHLGVKRTLGRIEERYYWPRLRQQVLNYVRECPQCQERKTPPVEPQRHMEIICVERPFEKVEMDILGSFPVSTGGKRNIIVAVNYLTKWAETRAVPTATARDAAEFFIEEIVLRHGAPEGVVTDCGKCFVA
ncbi:Uncharacterized protein APZ42_008203, partial [Daphnia magna]